MGLKRILKWSAFTAVTVGALTVARRWNKRSRRELAKPDVAWAELGTYPQETVALLTAGDHVLVEEVLCRDRGCRKFTGPTGIAWYEVAAVGPDELHLERVRGLHSKGPPTVTFDEDWVEDLTPSVRSIAPALRRRTSAGG